jgi:hypothetical protein
MAPGINEARRQVNQSACARDKKDGGVYHKLGGEGLGCCLKDKGSKRQMGAHPFVDVPVAGKRSAKRARVLLAARLRTGAAGEIDVRLRDLSQHGALVEGKSLPPQGSEVVFSRGSITVPARVAWTGEGRAGLEFAYAIDETEVLVQLKRTNCDSNQPRFRRPRLGEDMTEQDKKLARLWGVSVGIAVPGE